MTTDSIDTAKLMRSIRAEALGMTVDQPPIASAGVPPMTMMAEIDFDRTITSHRWLLRVLYVPIRKWVYREIRNSVQPIVERQTEYNRAMQAHVAALTDQLELQSAELEKLYAELAELRVQVASRAR